MGSIDFGYSKKNIPTLRKKSYIYKGIGNKLCIYILLIICIYIYEVENEIFFQNTKIFHLKVLDLLHFESCQNFTRTANLDAEI